MNEQEIEYPYVELKKSKLRIVTKENGVYPVCDLKQCPVRLLFTFVNEMPQEFKQNPKLIEDLKLKSAQWYDHQMEKIFG